jgi:hypothetical protein
MAMNEGLLIKNPFLQQLLYKIVNLIIANFIGSSILL